MKQANNSSSNQFTKKIWITAFAMFSMFFGGGNFILPPQLGSKAESQWLIVALGFCLSAVAIPLLGVLAQAKLQGTMLDFGKKVYPKFGLIIGALMYIICLTLPIPRTASVVYELSVAPVFSINPLLFNSLYFALVGYLCFNRNKIIGILGKYLTPLMLVIILFMIGKAIFFIDNQIPTSQATNLFATGLLEGYQTFDGIASIIIGGVITISLNMDSSLSFSQKKRITIYAGIISGISLFIIYTGFIYTGAILSSQFSEQATRSQILSGVSQHALGQMGYLLLTTAVTIVCFTTAVGIITGAGDFFKTISGGTNKNYNIVVILSCIIGIFLGKTGVEYIIKIAIPILVLIYPMVIMLIFLNLVSDKWTSTFIFRLVISITFLFSLPDFISALGITLPSWFSTIPLSRYNLAWVLPAFASWGIGILIQKRS